MPTNQSKQEGNGSSMLLARPRGSARVQAIRNFVRQLLVGIVPDVMLDTWRDVAVFADALMKRHQARLQLASTRARAAQRAIAA